MSAVLVCVFFPVESDRLKKSWSRLTQERAELRALQLDTALHISRHNARDSWPRLSQIVVVSLSRERSVSPTTRSARLRERDERWERELGPPEKKRRHTVHEDLRARPSLERRLVHFHYRTFNAKCCPRRRELASTAASLATACGVISADGEDAIHQLKRNAEAADHSSFFSLKHPRFFLLETARV